MKKKIFIIISAIINILLPLNISAISTADAIEDIDNNKKTNLTINYIYDDILINEADVKLYKVADIDEKFQYLPTSDFSSYPIKLNSVLTQEKWEEIRQTLESYIVADGIAPTIETKITNNKVSLPSLTNGLYLVMNNRIQTEDYALEFQNFLINLPALNTDGRWNYDVEVSPKPSHHEVYEKYQVMKVWEGNDSHRPNNVTVEIYRNGEFIEQQILSAENNWQYEWRVEKHETDTWIVVERDIPSNYNVKIVQKGNTFVVANSYFKVPNTGLSTKESSSASISTRFVLIIALVTAGAGWLIFRKRKNVEKN